MNTQVGKSAGIALLLAAGLLAALFAMGVFSANGVGADEHLTPAGADTDNLVGLEITADDGTVDVAEPGFVEDTAAYTINVPPATSSLKIVATGGDNWDTDASIVVAVDGKNLEGTLENFDTVADSTSTGTFTVDLTNGLAKEITVTAADGDANNGVNSPEDQEIPGTYTITLSYNSATSDETANAGVIIDLDSTLGDVPVDTLQHELSDPDDPRSAREILNVVQGGDITVALSGFGVPGDIDPDTVRVHFASSSGSPMIDVRKPSSIEVNGTTVTLTMGTVEDQSVIFGDTGTVVDQIVFQKKAGITNPSIANASADEYKITVTDSADDKAIGYGIVFREIAVSPSTAVRGSEITITGKGFVDGPADVATVGGVSLGTADSEDGVFKRVIMNNMTTGPDDDDVFSTEGTNINATDNAGASAPAPGTHEIKAGFTIDPESTAPGKTVEVKVTDQEGTLDSLTIRGATIVMDTYVSKDDDSTPLTFDLRIPSGTKVADKQQVRLVIQPPTPTGGTAPATVTLTGTINIIANELSITPDTVVPGQEISVDGSGFSTATGKNEILPSSDEDDDGTVDTSNIMIGGEPAENSKQLVNNSGNISFNVRVPDAVTPGSKKVTVEDAGGRVGQATITVAEPEITVDPAESLIGSEITVSGTGFPANDLVLIKYDGATVDTALTTPTGTFEQTIIVPSGGDPGAESDVEAVAQVQAVDAADKSTAETTHTLPEAAISLSPSEATAGSIITVDGANFKGFLQVYKIEIAEQNVTPVPAPATDKWGAFSANVQVPQLTSGRYSVKAIVEDSEGDSATEFLQVVVVAPSAAPADVFAGLGDNLQVVWQYDNATSMWASYDPAAPAELNDLDEVTSGDIVWIEVTEDQEFQGKQLYAGWNLITLN